MRIIDYFDRAVADDPDRCFSRMGDVAYTYAEAEQISHEIAVSLRDSGVESGHCVGILCRNHPRVLLAMLGIWRAGAVWAPLHTATPAASLLEFMNGARLRALLCDASSREQLPQVRKAVPSLVATVNLQDDTEWESFVAAGRGDRLDDWGDAMGSPFAPAARGMTGGTTGRAKSVMLTHQVFATLIEAAGHHFPRAERAVNLAATPISHAAGGVALAMTAMGATTLTAPRFDADTVLDDIETHGVTHLFLPPTAFYDLMERQRARPRDVSTLRLLLLAGSAVSPAKLAEGVELFGPCVGQSWGQAEAPMFATWLDPVTIAEAAEGVHPERLASCGRATFQTSVAVMADDGGRVPAGEIGELVIRGRLVAPEYADDPESTAEAHRHGWHHSGDIGRRDDHGYYYIVDRKKDMIISGGFNVYASDVEAVILGVPGVLECAVVGVPDERWGEAVTAYVVAKAGATLEPQLIAEECRRVLGPVRTPKSVHVVDRLPMTAVGKVDKVALRQAREQVAPR